MIDDKVAIQAIQAITGPRAVTHGDAQETMQRTAQLWAAYLGREISPAQVAICNLLQKLARSRHYDRDHYIDVIGYALIAEEAARPW
jgi:hypothetical protein